MAKKGTPFEEAVADVIGCFHDVQDVKQGEWASGPDGRRDRDVTFTAVRGTERFKGLIECKDYDPRKTGKVGIGIVDALDSKRKDLGIDIAVICSNAGFAKPALQKAKRVGIGCIGALRSGDGRIRFAITDSMFMRKVTVPLQQVQVDLNTGGLWDKAGLNANEIWLGDRSFESWVNRQIHLCVAANPIVTGNYCIKAQMIAPLILTSRVGNAEIRSIQIDFRITGSWYRISMTIRATTGIYDWQRKRVKLALNSSRALERTIDFSRGVPVSRPPDYVLEPLHTGESETNLVMLHAGFSKTAVPNFDPYIAPDDLNPFIPDIPEANRTSTPSYRHPED